MKRILWIATLAPALLAASPVITELRPRGAEIGKPFTLTVVGRDLAEGARLVSSLPAAITPLAASQRDGAAMAPGRAAAFLVELKADAAPGVYPVRIESAAGISNVLLFTIGTYPEVTEEESQPYARPHQNDTTETAEPVRSSPVVVNGTLRGPERDLFRVSGKAGEKRVFEVEARRCGSAIDAVLRILDGAGRQLARSNDAPGARLDPRLEFTFPKEGDYYVEVSDARFSTQAQNFYRLKMGAYQYAEEIYPLAGRRGEVVEVTFSGGNLKAPVKAKADLRQAPPEAAFTTVALPSSPALPFLFGVGDVPEAAGNGQPIAVPAAINGRLAQPAQSDRYQFAVRPGDKLLFELQAHELGTSRIEAVLTAYDEKGEKIASAGDQPILEDVFSVQGTSKTSSDPFLNVAVPEAVRTLTIGVEDLARRGGALYGYRLTARREAEDFRLAVVTPDVNIPKGGTTVVTVIADRRGYDGPVQLSVADLPQGLRAEGGMIPREYHGPNNIRITNPRGVLTLTAESDVELAGRQLVVWGEGKAADGTAIRRRARGNGFAVDVAGATLQGSVDFQRQLTAPWLGFDLPAATGTPAPATLEVRALRTERLEEGERTQYEYTWRVRSPGAEPAQRLDVDIPGARDLRITDIVRAPAGEPGTVTGTFNVSTTKATDPGRYDLVATGRLNVEGREERIVSRAIPFDVTAIGAATNAVASAR